MIKVNGKEWKKLKDAEKISYCEGLLKDAKQAREKRELEWYLNHMFKEGKHYLTYNTTTRSLEPNPPRKRGEVRMVVNKVRSSTRAIQNYITQARPKWEIIPGDTDDNTIKNARRLGKVMDYLYRKLHLEAMVSGLVEEALDKSVGWVELDWDEEAEGGLGQVEIVLHDAFDIWVARNAYLYAGRLKSAFVAKTPTRTLDEIHNDERYNEKTRTKVTKDDDEAVSSMKAKIIRSEGGLDEKKIPTATVKEFKLWDHEGNEKKGKIQLFTYAGNQVLRDEPLKETDYNMYCFQISMNPLKIYQRSWTADAIPLNKALDRSLSQKITYVNRALKHTIIAEKGHGAGVVTNEQGNIIEINKGRKFEQMAIQPLPAGFSSLDSEINMYIEDTLGAHDAALGRLPAGARSGKTLEALQAADSNNLAGITMSLESFLSVLGQEIMKVIAEKYVTSRVVKIADPDEGEEYIRVTGENGKRKDDSTVVTEDNEVIVKIGSWLGHTKEAQTDTLLRLAEGGIIPREAVLRHLEFPNIEEMSKKAQAEALEQHRLDAEIAGRNQQQGGQQQPDTSMQDLADKENMAMMQGQQVPPTEGADMTHTQAHIDFMRSNTFAGADPQSQQVVQAHVQGELQLQGVA